MGSLNKSAGHNSAPFMTLILYLYIYIKFQKQTLKHKDIMGKRKEQEVKLKKWLNISSDKYVTNFFSAEIIL